MPEAEDMHLDMSMLAVIGVVVFLIAGTIKGTVGIGLPTAAIGMLTLATAPRTAVAMLLFPMLFSNLWQVWRAGDIRGALRRYWIFAATLAVGVGVATLFVGAVSDRFLLGALGISILVFVAVNLALAIPALPLRLDRPAQVVLGLIAGIMGGLTAVWAPPMGIYLAARQVDKDEFVRATGLLIAIGSLPLLLGYVAQGFLTAPLAVMSLAMLVPTFLGFSLGEVLRRRLSQERFRKLLLLVFLVLGLNLVRRAVF